MQKNPRFSQKLSHVPLGQLTSRQGEEKLAVSDDDPGKVAKRPGVGHDVYNGVHRGQSGVRLMGNSITWRYLADASGICLGLESGAPGKNGDDPMRGQAIAERALFLVEAALRD